ncbi:hypothetical protein HS7_15450 [Sulfolobales archaeon HS-7]|nr:hypothetical protein HS7_15450 [Sulfolobales archaeon HS-7]
MSIREKMNLFGPAWVALLSNADAASFIGGYITGLEYGLRLVWFIMVLSIPLYVIQEASGRVGAVTGSGIGGIIRERYSAKLALTSIIPIFSVDLFTYLCEYAGIGIGFMLMGLNPITGIILAFIFHLLVFTSGKLSDAERILIGISGVLLTTSLIFVFPFHPVTSIFYFSPTEKFLLFMAVNVGAVVTPPCMPVYQSYSTAVKYGTIRGNTSEKLSWLSRETILGSVATEGIIVFAEILGARGFPTAVLSPDFLPRNFILGFLLVVAGFLALVVVSLASSWGVLEIFGSNRKRENALILYVLESFPALVIVAIYGNFLGLMNFAVSILSVSPIVITLPLLILGIVVSNRKIMGSNAYSSARSIVYFITLVFVFLMGVIGLAS